MSEEEGYIKKECNIIWALTALEVMEEDNLEESDMWNVEPYVEVMLE